MTQEQSFVIEVIALVPDESILFIQAPGIETSEILKLMEPSEFDYYTQIKLTAQNKKLLNKILVNEGAQEYFQNIEVKFNDKLLFEGHDGMEIGIISRSLKLPDKFIENYINTEMCIVSNEW